ncbi:hypothetical protein HMPREF9554_00758 [Treponema phagedenis F0421]|nr:hypothetical protein HMPREF9554_00758 [Treponema phagedenis F0421]
MNKNLRTLVVWKNQSETIKNNDLLGYCECEIKINENGERIFKFIGCCVGFDISVFKIYLNV